MIFYIFLSPQLKKTNFVFIVIFPANELSFFFFSTQQWKSSNPHCCRRKNNWVRERSTFMHAQSKDTKHTFCVHTQTHSNLCRPAHKQIAVNINKRMLSQIQKQTLGLQCAETDECIIEEGGHITAFYTFSATFAFFLTKKTKQLNNGIILKLCFSRNRWKSVCIPASKTSKFILYRSKKNKENKTALTRVSCWTSEQRGCEWVCVTRDQKPTIKPALQSGALSLALACLTMFICH